MTLLQATALLIDCAKTHAHENDRPLLRAIARMEKRLELLELRKAKTRYRCVHRAWEWLHFASRQLANHDEITCWFCGFDISFGDFAKSVGLRGNSSYVVTFDCPACSNPLMFENHVYNPKNETQTQANHA